MEMNSRNQYAAVILTALNRDEHFIRCMESLDNNTWAEYTDIYISVDYPPTEKYVDGYQKIVDYLKSRKFHFKRTNIYIQEENLGARENRDFLRNIAFSEHDKLIMMEDDMEVSVNFFEYMNKAFDYCEENPEIFGVCAYQIPVDACEGTAYKTQHISWGFGTFKKNWDRLQNEVSEEWLDKYVWNVREMFELFKCSKRTFYYLYNNYLLNKNPIYFGEDRRIRTIDIIKEIYLRKTKQYVLLPTVTKIKNNGFDGSGVNCGSAKQRANEIDMVDQKDTFNLILEDNKKNISKLVKVMSWAGVNDIKFEVYLSFALYLFYWMKRKIG